MEFMNCGNDKIKDYTMSKTKNLQPFSNNGGDLSIYMQDFEKGLEKSEKDSSFIYGQAKKRNWKNSNALNQESPLFY